MENEKLINEMLNVIRPVLEKENGRKLDFPTEFTFFHVLERIRFNLQTIDLLIKTDIVLHEHAVGLCCRNLLSDFITTGFIIKQSKDQNEYYVNLYRLYYTDLRRTDSFFNMFSGAGFATEDEIKKYNEKKNDPNDIYKLVFDYAAEFELKQFPSNAAIIEQFIKSDGKDLWNREIINSYDVYTFYSKYEHLGWHSYSLTRSGNKEKLYERLHTVLSKTTILLSSCFEILKEDTELASTMAIMNSTYKN